jgi:dTDP-4-dehydrorhamnose reductase
MKRAMVTGAAGLLGQHLVNVLLKNHEVLAIDLAPNPFEPQPNLVYIQGDLLDNELLGSKLEFSKADIIFNCAAYTDVDGCEKNKVLADKLNVELVRKLLNLPYDKLVHYSTDYVFDGQTGPYSENDQTNPIECYGFTKLESEKIVMASGRPFLIIRSNVLFGMAKNVRPNFVTWLIDNLRRGNRLRIVSDQYNNPISAVNLAEASIEAAGLDYAGILHIGGAEYLSRYEMAVSVAHGFGLDKSLIQPITTAMLGQSARRPLKGGLKIDKARNLLKTELLGFKAGLKSMQGY